MAKVGVLIETEDGKVKQTNFGALSAARAGGANDVFALLVDGEAETLKEELSGYGARHIVALNPMFQTNFQTRRLSVSPVPGAAISSPAWRHS